MAPKMDVNRSGWESTDMPSVCEECLGDNPYLQMLKEEYGAECKICSRPFTLFKWKKDRTSRQRATQICLTCARMKNACQHCLRDLSYGLPLPIRDAALKMAAGPQNELNKQYHAQENETKLLEMGSALPEEYDRQNDKAKDLLTRLANSEPYYKKQRRLELEAEEGADAPSTAQKALPPAGSGPIRPRDSKMAGAIAARGGARGGRGGARGGLRGSQPIRPEDIRPPQDKNITSLFVTGVEDDLPEHELRTYFAKFGTLRSLICSHRAHSAFVNYATRQGAETAAESCQGKAVVKGVPLKVQWGKPKPLDTLDREQRIEYAKAGRAVAPPGQRQSQGGAGQKAIEAAAEEDDLDSLIPPAPPGEADVEYASLAGN